MNRTVTEFAAMARVISSGSVQDSPLIRTPIVEEIPKLQGQYTWILQKKRGENQPKSPSKKK